jgi:hypothetical protein
MVDGLIDYLLLTNVLLVVVALSVLLLCCGWMASMIDDERPAQIREYE